MFMLLSEGVGKARKVLFNGTIAEFVRTARYDDAKFRGLLIRALRGNGQADSGMDMEGEYSVAVCDEPFICERGTT